MNAQSNFFVVDGHKLTPEQYAVVMAADTSHGQRCELRRIVNRPWDKDGK